MPTPAQSEMVVTGKTVRDVFSDPALAGLARAACEGETAAVAEAVQAGVDPNGQGFQGTTPLFWALRCENAHGVEALLKGGADPNYRFPGEQGFTAVYSASSMKDPAFLRLLLQYGGNPTTGIPDGDDTALKAALYLGIATNGWENFHALLDAGYDVNAHNQYMPLPETAVYLNSYGAVNELLERGYTYNLEELALKVANANFEFMTPEQIRHRARTIELLEARGIVVPPDR